MKEQTVSTALVCANITELTHEIVRKLFGNDLSSRIGNAPISRDTIASYVNLELQRRINKGN
jgi:hypothetical protein